MEISSEKIYCIPGLGVDEKIFEGIVLPGLDLHHIKPLNPLHKESLENYAKRLTEQITHNNPVLIGVSFGGMLAIEIAKHIAVEKIIIISGVKHHKEIPRWMRISGALGLHKIIPVKSNRFTERADDRRIGVKTIEEKKLVTRYREKADKIYLAWAMDKILNWKNTWLPENLFHIHGEDDRLFPINNIAATHFIPQGTHIMMVNKTAEINECLRRILSQ